MKLRSAGPVTPLLASVIVALLTTIPTPSANGETANATVAKTSTPTPFEALYTATYNGSEFEDLVTRKLERLPDGTYKHSYTGDHLLYFLHEESIVDMKGCNTQPLRYISKRGNFFRKREKTIDFDWKQQIARFNDEGTKGQFKLEPDTVDPMSVYLRIACQVTNEIGTLTFPETDDNHIEKREYRLLGKETLNTASGSMETVRIERVHKNKKRQTYIWLMASNPVVVVRVRQTDTDGSVYSLDLTQWKAVSAK